MNCPKCGKNNPPDYIYCDNCGSELSSAMPSGNECLNCRHVNPADSAFCENCGSSMPLQTSTPASSTMPVQQPTPLTTQPISSPQVQMPQVSNLLVMPDGTEVNVQGQKTIGRVDLAKYANPDQEQWISRQHFKIWEEDGTTFIVDDKSSNGTKLNGQEIRQQGKQPLRNGDEILVGDAVKLLFKTRLS
jgi:hypothetical protein